MREKRIISMFDRARRRGATALAWLIAFVICGVQASPSVAMEQSQHQQADKMGGVQEEEVAHPFFTHMGVPEAVGVFNLRFSGLASRTDGDTVGDFAFHFETGLTDFIGLHVRNDRFLENPHTEVMFQFAAVRSKNKMSGFSPIMEFEIPTLSGNGTRIHTLVGFSSAIANSRAAFNQVLHYNSREDMVDGSVSFVLRVGERWYPVIEVLAEAMNGDTPIVNALLGLKVRVNEILVLGVALQVPTTSRKDFSSEMVFQSDMEWGRPR